MIILWATIILLCQSSLSSRAGNPPTLHASDSSHRPHQSEGVPQHVDRTVSGWEGSAEGRVYSEFNHRLAGVAVMVIGLSELHDTLRIAAWPWMRLLLPGAMLVAGTYLTVWSDHDAWPIGSRTFMDMFFGSDAETLQHKSYAVLLLVVGIVELLRRSGRLQKRYWGLPLQAFAVIGGLLLFLHSHGDHPSAHTIALHHLTMGVTALMAGLCLIVSQYGSAIVCTPSPRVRWKRAWGILILIIGIQLLTYTEA